MRGSRRADSIEIRCQTFVIYLFCPLYIPIYNLRQDFVYKIYTNDVSSTPNYSETKYLFYGGHYRLMAMPIQTRGQFYMVPGSTTIVVHVLVQYPKA